MEFAELTMQRQQTEAVSMILLSQLQDYLETLKPLLAPQRLLGKYVGGKAEVPGADRALAQLQELYKGLPIQPYNLPRDFDSQWLTLIGDDIQVHPWEYCHEVKTENGVKGITITSPLSWVVTFGGQYTFSQFRLALSGKEPRRKEHVRQFAINAIVTHMVFSANPGLIRLFTDLRYEVKMGSVEPFPGLPLTMLNGCLRSRRPDDSVILAATAFSGVPVFIELADPGNIPNFPDPLRGKVVAAMK
jgi:hypothetical protein